MFSKLYLDTTNPRLSLPQLFQPSILFPLVVSVVFHTIVYVGILNWVSYIFFNKILTNPVNVRLTVSLVVIMFLGFLARFYHVKDIYRAYGEDATKTRNHLDKLYISWVFIS